jgi:hypothetical protein
MGRRASATPSTEPEKAQHYRKKVAQIKDFLAKNDKKRGPTGNEQKSNLTDPESAKMTSSHGVIQGYNSLAVVDGQSQIVVHAEAHGSGYEAHLLAPLIEATRKGFAELELDEDIFTRAKVTADSGFHSNVVVTVEVTGADAYIADRDYRKREPEFAGASRYKARDKKERGLRRKREREARENDESKLFTFKDFLYGEANARCICPAGHQLYNSGRNLLFNGYRVDIFKAPKTACRGCHLRERCLRHPDRTPHRQLMIIKHPEGGPPKRRSKSNGAAQRMRQKFDTPFGRELYGRRMDTVEPVFANIQNKGIRRFTLRGQKKVST